jgi:hypothetical protein
MKDQAILFNIMKSRDFLYSTKAYLGSVFAFYLECSIKHFVLSSHIIS